MAAKILALFNLKEGVSVSDYENWSKTVDIPTVNGLGSIEKFEVFKTTGLLFSEDKPPYQYFETIDILDMDQFGEDAGSESMQKVAAEFQEMTSDLVFITTEKL
ncbi:REDY-like protein HapK [Litorimonas haliclonae]|uniref:REDY-like protein HapK n=1 Tax=Litorimonas haliclonae TaxID=2081977 RepID=UPI0039F147C1